MMSTKKAAPTTIDEYIATYPGDVRERLEQIRETIKQEVPKAAESISYGIPTFKLNGKPLIYFGGYKHHIGLYPVPRGSEAFAEELSGYDGGKGTAKFPLDQPIPFDLIKRIVRFRASEITGEPQA